MIGVLTGADIVAMSRPFPVGVDGARPYYAAAADVARYAGEPLAVVVARDRYIAEDALELIEVEYEPLEPVLDPRRARSPPIAASATAIPMRRSRKPTSSSRRRSTSLAGVALPSSATASSPTGTPRQAR